MRMKMLWLFFGVPYCTCAAASTPETEKDLATIVLEQCGDDSQAGIRHCLNQKVRDSSKALVVAEQNFAIALKKWDEEINFKTQAHTKLVLSTDAFARYRTAQCTFASSLGGGAVSNALELRRLSCEYALNMERGRFLRALQKTIAATD